MPSLSHTAHVVYTALDNEIVQAVLTLISYWIAFKLTG